MRKPVDELNKALTDIFGSIKHNRKIQISAVTELSKYNVKIATLNQVMADYNYLEHQSEIVLCLICSVLYDLTKEDKINPSLFFNPVEITKAKQYAGDLSEKIEYPIVIENVIRVGSQHDYVTAMSAQDIVRWNDAGVLNYNYETQRTAKETVKNDGSINKRPDVNMKSVKQIQELVLKNKFKPDTITFNILLDGNDDIDYDDKNKRLIINSASQIDILDGFHRILGISGALEVNPDINLHLNVAIKNYDVEAARFYFGQINTVNVVGKARIKELKNERISDMIVTELNRKSELSGKISSKNTVSNKLGQLTNFTILADAIEDVFKPQNKKNLLDITPYLVNFFDYLIGSFQEAFVTNILEVKEYSWINHHNMFVGYIVLAKKFYDAGKPVNHIQQILSNIDFSKENSELTDIFRGQGKENSNKIKKLIAAHFEKIDI